ncbi:MAG: hypothetical protein J6B66_01375, partial [Anaerotignum sp.]|nr:hypothetical protein [Anaerotignum sp.]
ISAVLVFIQQKDLPLVYDDAAAAYCFYHRFPSAFFSFAFFNSISLFTFFFKGFPERFPSIWSFFIPPG